MKVVVTGLVGLHPFGGVAWDYFQYVIGLHRLGHDVVYHEDTAAWPYDPVAGAWTADPAYATAFIDGFFRRWAPELRGRWHYRHLRQESHGLSEAAFGRFAAEADVFLNVSGASPVPNALGPRCRTVFLDTDPGYNQIVLIERPAWSPNVDLWAEQVRDHDRHFTYAESIHDADSRVPHADLHWAVTRMPIVLDLWREIAAPPPAAPWTTVMTWNAFAGPLVHAGEQYHSKDRSFAPLFDLPLRAGVPMRVAIGGEGSPLDRLARGGWGIDLGPDVTRTPADYRAYIAASCGEFSVAKHVYVALRTGWFSCRSACYLAAGRPVVTQDTGFSDILPLGRGLFAFRTAEEALDALETIHSDWKAHSAAAREVAREWFDSDSVLADLLSSIETVPGAPPRSS